MLLGCGSEAAKTTLSTPQILAKAATYRLPAPCIQSTHNTGNTDSSLLCSSYFLLHLKRGNKCSTNSCRALSDISFTFFFFFLNNFLLNFQNINKETKIFFIQWHSSENIISEDYKDIIWKKEKVSVFVLWHWEFPSIDSDHMTGKM